MNIVDKIIQNLCGDSGADSTGTAAERKKPDTAPLVPKDNGGRIWKDRRMTLKDKAQAKAAYEKIYSKRCNISNLFDTFNSDGSFTDALMGLDFFTAEEREEFMDICRQLARTCYCEEEKEFYRVVRRGYLDDYSADNCGRPDLSVMRDISPRNYPYFLAVCAASGNGCNLTSKTQKIDTQNAKKDPQKRKITILEGLFLGA